MAVRISQLVSIVDKVRTWGLVGVANYFRGKFENRQRKRWFLDNARQYPMQPTRGITIVANLSAKMSISKVMRDLAAMLKDAGVPFQTYDLGEDKGGLPKAETERLITPRTEFRALKYDHVLEMFASPFPRELGIKTSRIVFWEFDSGLLEYYPAVFNADEIIGMSDFNVEVFRQMMPANVAITKLLYPFRFNIGELPSAAEMRARFKLAPDDFVVFFNFDFGSSYGRKNPDGAIRAFAKAFSNEPRARLVFKTMGAKRHPTELATLHALAAELGVADRFLCVNDYLPIKELYGLTAASDCYLSLHRGEGFGLGIAEAMCLGKPVVVTDYSSTTEFCNTDNAMLVPFQLVEVPANMHDHACYRAVRRWAEPDTTAAAAALRRLFDDSDLRERLGRSGRTFIRELFSLSNFRDSVNAYLG